MNELCPAEHPVPAECIDRQREATAEKGADSEPAISRRRWMTGVGTCTLAALAAPSVWNFTEHLRRAATFIGRAYRYDDSLVAILRDGLREIGFGRDAVRDKSILLKPNLVEPAIEAPHINTHPAVVRAVAEVFRSWDAREVIVAEGQGHIRDAWLVLEQSGLEPVLREAALEFIDLNHDDVYTTSNRLGMTPLKELYLPRTLQRADIIVSLPKMKTHHWAGVTLSMKNLFGVMPGICYGWPKNVLHHCGIGRSILDITATVRPQLAIVDGIIGMEGDGPIMGTPRQANVLVMGTNLPAVDATAARLMGFDPQRLDFLRVASGRLGPILERHVEQRGELIANCAQRFELVDHPHFRKFRS